MTRQETQVLKGVAILLMMFLHLFNQMCYVDITTPLLYIGDIPLVYLLTRCSNPVAFYLILGGYGLYSVYRKGDNNRYKRVLILLIHFWIILFIFVSIGHILNSTIYPGSWQELVLNISTLDLSYNGEWWFLFPYLCLSLTSPFLFKLFDRFLVRYVLLVTFVIYLLTSFIISRYGAEYLYDNLIIYNPFLYFALLFPFSLGAMVAKVDFFGKIKKWFESKCMRNYMPILALLFLIVFRCFFSTSAFHPIYALLFISIFLLIKRPKFIDTIFEHLGAHSMNMWLIHSWFCYYLFSDFIYGFKYPVIIFLVLTVVSYLSSVIVNLIAKPIIKVILK